MEKFRVIKINTGRKIQRNLKDEMFINMKEKQN